MFLEDVFAHKETCSEELHVERLVDKALKRVGNGTKLELIWGSTMYHKDDLPFDVLELPDIYTQFRKSVEANCRIRSSTRIPVSIGPTPCVDNWGDVPTLGQLGLEPQEVNLPEKIFRERIRRKRHVSLRRKAHDLLKVYKETRNGMLGPDYSTKFSPWLAFGCISPRFIYEEVVQEMCKGNGVKIRGCLSPGEMARQGVYPLIDANMKELSTTGFMSNRGRQIVCSFLVRDMGLDWRMGAEWFETCLLDYDPCSNYGNWTYGAGTTTHATCGFIIEMETFHQDEHFVLPIEGVGNDPREDRYFSIPKQAQNYDPEGEYVAFWVQQLRRLPKEKRHWPGRLMYMDTVVPLKHGHGGGNAQTSRGSKSRGGFRDNHSGRR
ncbi:hypothetical protein YC2023_113503 [Brassica napus]